MEEINQMELLNLKSMIEKENVNYQKLTTYASQAVDPQIKQIFTKAAQNSLNTKQKLLTFLN